METFSRIYWKKFKTAKNRIWLLYYVQILPLTKVGKLAKVSKNKAHKKFDSSFLLPEVEMPCQVTRNM